MLATVSPQALCRLRKGIRADGRASARLRTAEMPRRIEASAGNLSPISPRSLCPKAAARTHLFVEFRVRTNGLSTAAGNSLLGALAHFGLDSRLSRKLVTSKGSGAATLAVSAKPLNHGVVEGRDNPVAKCNAHQVLKRILGPSRIGHGALGDGDFIAPQRHVRFHAQPSGRRPLSRFPSRSVPFIRPLVGGRQAHRP